MTLPGTLLRCPRRPSLQLPHTLNHVTRSSLLLRALTTSIEKNALFGKVNYSHFYKR